MNTIEDCCKYRGTKELRVLRDLLGHDPKLRGVATHILKKLWDRTGVEDVLTDTFEIESCAGDVFLELNINPTGINNYSSSTYEDLYTIFRKNPEVSLKKSALEQLSILINDRSDNLGATGRKLFREDQKEADIFSLVVKEIINIQELTSKRGINNLHPNELNFIQELCRFLALSFLFYFDEPVVAEIIKSYHEVEDSEDFEESILCNLIESLKICLSSKIIEIRKHALR